MKVNLWEHPYVSPASPIIKAIEPYGLWGGKIGSRQWENGSRHKYGFGGFVPDMTLEAARDIYWRHHRDAIVSLGVDGFKVDETDSFSANASLDLYFPGGLSCNAYHNLLGTLTVNFLHARYRRDFNRRSFMYSRGNYAGMQRWATAAYTDFYGFPQFVMSLIAQSYSGTYYTPEIRSPPPIRSRHWQTAAAGSSTPMKGRSRPQSASASPTTESRTRFRLLAHAISDAILSSRWNLGGIVEFLRSEMRQFTERKHANSPNENTSIHRKRLTAECGKW